MSECSHFDMISAKMWKLGSVYHLGGVCSIILNLVFPRELPTCVWNWYIEREMVRSVKPKLQGLDGVKNLEWKALSLTTATSYRIVPLLKNSKK